jgi:hypothetical protein
VFLARVRTILVDVRRRAVDAIACGRLELEHAAGKMSWSANTETMLDDAHQRTGRSPRAGRTCSLRTGERLMSGLRGAAQVGTHDFLEVRGTEQRVGDLDRLGGLSRVEGRHDELMRETVKVGERELGASGNDRYALSVAAVMFLYDLLGIDRHNWARRHATTPDSRAVYSNLEARVQRPSADDRAMYVWRSEFASFGARDTHRRQARDVTRLTVCFHHDVDATSLVPLRQTLREAMDGDNGIRWQNPSTAIQQSKTGAI